MDHWILATITMASAIFGFLSAFAWLYASRVKISRFQALARRKKEALLSGETPNLGGASLDGWDMSATFSAQAKWNSLGAALAAGAVGLQALGQALGSV